MSYVIIIKSRHAFHKTDLMQRLEFLSIQPTPTLVWASFGCSTVGMEGISCPPRGRCEEVSRMLIRIRAGSTGHRETFEKHHAII